MLKCIRWSLLLHTLFFFHVCSSMSRVFLYTSFECQLLNARAIVSCTNISHGQAYIIPLLHIYLGVVLWWLNMKYQNFDSEINY